MDIVSLSCSVISDQKSGNAEGPASSQRPSKTICACGANQQSRHSGSGYSSRRIGLINESTDDFGSRSRRMKLKDSQLKSYLGKPWLLNLTYVSFGPSCGHLGGRLIHQMGHETWDMVNWMSGVIGWLWHQVLATELTGSLSESRVYRCMIQRNCK